MRPLSRLLLQVLSIIVLQESYFQAEAFSLPLSFAWSSFFPSAWDYEQGPSTNFDSGLASTTLIPNPHSVSCPLAALNSPPKGLRVVTDIDDTVKSSGNVRLAGIPLGGIDAQYKRGDFYPGVFQFAWELATHNTPLGQRPMPVAVLTARAREFLFALELNEEHPVTMRYKQCGLGNGALCGWGIGPVLYGSVKEWVVPEGKGQRKVKNFKKLVEEDGGCDYVFIGDIGEKDLEAGESMCQQYPQLMKALFFHVVSNTEHVQIPQQRSVNNVPVFYFKTYVGAALSAYTIGLLDLPAVDRVVEAAKTDLARLQERDPYADWTTKWGDLSKDIAYVQRLKNPWSWNFFKGQYVALGRW